VEGFLHYSKVVNNNVKNSCEDAICIVNHSIPKDVRVLESTISICYGQQQSLHLSLQVLMRQTWVIVQVITNKLLLVIKQCVLNQN
jgi:hypothetical protein